MTPVVVDKFLGEINTRTANKLPLGALTLSNNVQVTSSGSLKMRTGFSLVAAGTSIVGSYGTNDERFIFVVDSGTLYRFDNSGFCAIANGLNSSATVWTEETSNRVFMSSPGVYVAIDDGERITDLGIPKPVGVSVQTGLGGITIGAALISAQYKSEDGLLGPLSDPVAVTMDGASVLVTVPAIAGFTAVVSLYVPKTGAWHVVGEAPNFLALNTLPDTAAVTDELYFDVEAMPPGIIGSIAFYQSRIAVAVLESPTLTRIQFSVPYHYHLFHTTDDRFEIPDQVTGMLTVDGQLLITCRNSIFVFTADSRLIKLVDYGTPAGKPIQRLPEGGALIWTNRGVCKYPEFQNLTQDSVSLPPGNGCSTTLWATSGDQYLLVCNDGGGAAYNPN